MFTKIQEWIRTNRSDILLSAAGIIAISSIYLFKLGSFVRGDSVYENPGYLGTESISQIIDHISLGPIKIAQYLMQQIDQPNATLLRLLSVFIVVLAMAAFYRLIAKWHSKRVGFFALLLFATTSYSLHMARFTNQDVLYLALIPTILLFGTWMKSKKFVVRLRYILPAAALMLYVPGVIYIFAILGVIFRKRIKLAFRVAPTRSVIISAIVSGLLMLPLLLSLATRSSQLSEYFAVDVLTKQSPLNEALMRLADIPHAIFLTGPNEPFRWLTGTPILDIATVVLLILGIYAYIRGPHTLRIRTLGILLLAMVVLYTTGSVVSLAWIVALLYIVIANGIAYLLLSWFTVFPRNPAARNTAIALIVVLVTVICGYHLYRYFVAWPNAPQTKNALSVKSL